MFKNIGIFVKKKISQDFEDSILDTMLDTLSNNDISLFNNISHSIIFPYNIIINIIQRLAKNLNLINT